MVQQVFVVHSAVRKYSDNKPITIGDFQVHFTFPTRKDAEAWLNRESEPSVHKDVWRKPIDEFSDRWYRIQSTNLLRQRPDKSFEVMKIDVLTKELTYQKDGFENYTYSCGCKTEIFMDHPEQVLKYCKEHDLI